MKRISIKTHISRAILLSLLMGSFGCSSLSKNCRLVKRNYSQSWTAINELATRKAPQKEAQQAKIREEQCEAFRFLSERWEENSGNNREVIEMALLRWGWLPGDAFPNTNEVVDYKMVYMEFLQKTVPR